MRHATLGVVLALAGLLAAARVHASGFAVSEQSARGLGSAFAGEAATAEDASTVFWNPAGLTLLDGTQVTMSGFIVDLRASIHNEGSTLNPDLAIGGGEPLKGPNSTGGEYGWVPAGFFSQAIGDRLRVGIGMNSPFGLRTEWDRGWVGRYNALLSDLRTINLNPTVAYRLFDWLSLGAGMSAQHAQATLTNSIDLGSVCQENAAKGGLPPPACVTALHVAPQSVDGTVRLRGNGWAYGYNFGLLAQPTDHTHLGVAYRSRVGHGITGNAEFFIPPQGQILQKLSGALVNTPAHAHVVFPDSLQVAFFQDLTDTVTLMGDYTWTNWSQFKELTFRFTNPKQPPVTDTENWRDNYRFGLGVRWTPSKMWSFRAGTAYEQTPVPTPEDRSPRIPDSNRIWLAAGLAFTPIDRLRFDLGYSHIFVTETSINHPDPATGSILRGDVNGAADVAGVQVTYGFDLKDWGINL
jgi:long-chain fatty acid transport protein